MQVELWGWSKWGEESADRLQQLEGPDGWDPSGTGIPSATVLCKHTYCKTVLSAASLSEARRQQEQQGGQEGCGCYQGEAWQKY